MDFFGTAKKIVCSIIATALAMTVAAVEGLLPHRPDWLERVANLADTLKSVYETGGHPDASPASARDSGEAAPEFDQSRLLLAYTELWEFVQEVRNDGLSLDDEFCDRIEREWSVTTLLTYLRSADRTLRDHANTKLVSASAVMSPPQNGD
jgi:hypothetical protein